MVNTFFEFTESNAVVSPLYVPVSTQVAPGIPFRKTTLRLINAGLGGAYPRSAQSFGSFCRALFSLRRALNSLSDVFKRLNVFIAGYLAIVETCVDFE